MEPKFQTPGRAGSVGELAGNFGNLSCSDRSIVNIRLMDEILHQHLEIELRTD